MAGLFGRAGAGQEVAFVDARTSLDARMRDFFRLAMLALVLMWASADYVVAAGDTMGGIAADHGVSLEALIEANGVADPDLIRVGQILVIPGAAGTASTYAVQPGDTLADIAKYLGVAVSTLVSANQLSNPDLLRIGQQLTVPGAPTQSAAPPVPDGSTHTVESGDTLASIAARYDVTVDSIAVANGITNPSLIYVGTTLRVIGPVGPTVEAVAPSASHTVTSGESLNSVAARYGVSIDSLVSSNDLADPNLIRVGQVLTIPGAPGEAWICPVAGATYFNDWGFPRSGGRLHTGNDLFAPLGTPVVAPVSGTLQAKSGPVGGLQFRLYGEDGTTYIGSHLDTVIASGYVIRGQAIGTVGSTGNAAGAKPHLHFEMLPGDGLEVNPYPVLRAAEC